MAFNPIKRFEKLSDTNKNLQQSRGKVKASGVKLTVPEKEKKKP